MNDHDLLIRIDGRVGELYTLVKEHEKRISALERWRTWILGAVTVIAAFFGIKLSGGGS